MDWNKVIEPTLILNKKRAKQNIAQMAERAAKFGANFRPHFKTHQSAGVGRWFRQAGVFNITVSSIKMAEYFSQNGWDDILCAFPVNIREIERINLLAAKINLGLLLLDPRTASYLNEYLLYPVEVWLKIDAGYERSGIEATDWETLEKTVQIIQFSNKLILKGLLTHSGNTYQAKSVTEINAIQQNELEKLVNLKKKLATQFPNLKISMGDTPSCLVSEHYTQVDEMRPGVFVFNDLMMHNLGVCPFDNIALAIALPIVATYPSRQEVVVHGGAVHLSKEQVSRNGQVSYGQVIDLDTWQPIDGAFVKRLSQEHGIVHVPSQYAEQFYIGQLLGVVPVHACLTANLHANYLGTDGKLIEKYQSGI